MPFDILYQQESALRSLKFQVGVINACGKLIHRKLPWWKISYNCNHVKIRRQFAMPWLYQNIFQRCYVVIWNMVDWMTTNIKLDDNGNSECKNELTIPKSKVKNTTTFKLQSNKMDEMASKHLKPAYSHPCLIAMALKNSRTGFLSISEIYNFLCIQLPYFKTVSKDWKRNIRKHFVFE